MAAKASKVRRVMTILGIFVGALLVIAIVLKLAFPLPENDDRHSDIPLANSESALADAFGEITQAHPNKTGIAPLALGIDSFAMRIALARAAERSIDARYYIWEDDLTGRLLLSELIAAADRGVRVRILVDDNPTAGLDGFWAAANLHPNLAVRIFNPLTIRRPRFANYLFDFPRLNRRMHNKSFMVDGTAAVIGGRNVGDVYFGAKDEGLFIDLDVLAVGAVTSDIERDFERYWQAEASYPAERILAKGDEGRLTQLRNPNFVGDDRAAAYRKAADDVIEGQLLSDPDEFFEFMSAELLSDNPEKALRRLEEDELLAARIAPLIESAEDRFDLVSGYFVPGDFGTNLIAGIAERGVKTRVVTNSIQVTDVPVVHAGYAPYRKRLLTAGAALYEAKPHKRKNRDHKDMGRTRFSGGGESVHAKTFAIDADTVFVGSFNFDPRSALLNCEMGLVIKSERFAGGVRNVLDERLPDNAYAVALDKPGSMTWTENDEVSGRVTHDVEPGTNVFQRGMVKALGWLPIEWLL